MFLISFVVEMEPLLRVNAFSRGSNSWRIFTYKELHAATNGFNEENKLGERGFGSVYWGKTYDDLQVIILIFWYAYVIIKI